MTKEEYKKYVKQSAPKSKIWSNVIWAFIVGGFICVIAQAIGDLYKTIWHMNTEEIKIALPVTMIFLGAIFTGFNVYDNIAKYAGAGSLVPITGFSNSITSPAMEFKSEGYILGMASKMFVVAGPVLVYGIISGVVVGFLYVLEVSL